MNINFNGKVAIVTGATRGIGKKIADDLAALGAELILTGTKKGDIDGLNKASLTKKEKKKYFCVDFSKNDSTVRFLEEIKKMNRIDICVNNAGINKVGPIDKTKIEDWDNIVSVNLKAPFLLMRAVSGVMKKNKYGRIINIASMYGVISKEGRSIYSTTKFGLRGMTKAVSNELAKYGVLVNAVSPGFVKTDLTRGILGEKEMERLAKEVPVGRFADPEDISRVVLFLASEYNSYITGKNIIVDGGYIDA